MIDKQFEIFIRTIYSLWDPPNIICRSPLYIFITTRGEGIHVKQISQGPTNFQKAMCELGINFIYANSPQTRGRIKRTFGVFQDKLIAELAFQGITEKEKEDLERNPKIKKKHGKRHLKI